MEGETARSDREVPVPGLTGERAEGQRRQTVFVVVLAVVLRASEKWLIGPAWWAGKFSAAMDEPFGRMAVSSFAAALTGFSARVKPRRPSQRSECRATRFRVCSEVLNREAKESIYTEVDTEVGDDHHAPSCTGVPVRNSQAVRLPKEFRFNVDRVEITQEGDALILRPHVEQGDSGHR